MATLTAAALLADRLRTNIYLFIVSAYRRSDGVTVPLYFSTSKYATEPGDSIHVPFRNLVQQGFSFTAPFIAPEVFSVAENKDGGTFVLKTLMGELDSLRETYALDGRAVTIKWGGVHSDGRVLPYASFVTVKGAVVESALYGLDEVSIKTKESTRSLDVQMEQRRYWGGKTAIGGDGSSQYVTLGTWNGVTAGTDYGSKFASLTGDLTIEGKFLVDGSHSSGDILALVSAGAVASGRPFHVELLRTVGAPWNMTVRWSKGNVAKSTTFATSGYSNHWSHWTVRFSGTTITALFYDRVNNTWLSLDYTHADVAGRDAMTAGSVYAMRTYGGTNYFQGFFTKLRVFSTALSTAIIKERFDRKLLDYEIAGVASTICVMDFDDGTGGEAADRADNPTLGTLPAALGAPVTSATMSARKADNALGVGNAFTSNTNIFSGLAAGDALLSSGWAISANNGNCTVAAIGGPTSAVYWCRVTGLTLQKEVYAAASPGQVREYIPSGKWYRTLMDDGDDDDHVQATLPNCFGVVEGWAPMLVDRETLVWQVHSYKIDGFDSFDEGAAPRPLPSDDGSLGVDYTGTSLRSFLGGTTVPGYVDTLIDENGSFFRFGGAPPEKAIHAWFRGGLHKWNGDTYSALVGDVLRSILQDYFAAISTGSLNATSFADLSADFGAAASAPIGLVVDDGRSVKDAVTELLEATGASLYYQRADQKLAVRRYEGAAGAAIVDTLTDDDIESVEPVEAAGPAWRVELSFRRCRHVIGTGDLLESARGTAKWRFYQNEFRFAQASDSTVLTEHPLARELKVIAGGITMRRDAQAEASRRLALNRDEPQILKLCVRDRPVQLDRFDGVTVLFRDFDEFGVPQVRLGLDSVAMVVLGVEQLSDDGKSYIWVCRENSTP